MTLGWLVCWFKGHSEQRYAVWIQTGTIGCTDLRIRCRRCRWHSPPPLYDSAERYELDCETGVWHKWIGKAKAPEWIQRLAKRKVIDYTDARKIGMEEGST